MNHDELYELVHDAVTAAVERQLSGQPVRMSRRMVGGRVLFEDDHGREVREKLRVLEQKLNNNDSLSLADKAEYQDLLTRAYGSLTTFNFLFEDEGDRFKGSGG